jgi:hypothetical protein
LEPQEFEILPENEEVVKLFLRVQTQWRTSFGGFIGLDYTPVFETMRLYDITDKRGVLEDLQVMEQAALSVLNKSAGDT